MSVALFYLATVSSEPQSGLQFKASEGTALLAGAFCQWFLPLFFCVCVCVYVRWTRKASKTKTKTVVFVSFFESNQTALKRKKRESDEK